MGDIFEKLGIYDLLAVLLSGGCIMLSTVMAGCLIGGVSIEYPLQYLQSDYAWIILIVDYFLGMLFQEIGSILYKECLFPDDEILKRTLNELGTTHESLTQVEKDAIYNIVQKKLNLDREPNEVEVYACCRAYTLSGDQKGKANLDQAIAGMGRSLSVYFCSLSLFLLGAFLATLKRPPKRYDLIVLSVISFLGALLFYERCLRFTKMRYIEIVRSFYYDSMKNRGH